MPQASNQSLEKRSGLNIKVWRPLNSNKQSTMERANDSAFHGFILLLLQPAPAGNGSLCGHPTIYFWAAWAMAPLYFCQRWILTSTTSCTFFLSNLSFMDLCLTTCTVPQTLANFKGKDKTITYGGCVTQLFIALGLGGVECVLLSVMALWPVCSCVPSPPPHGDRIPSFACSWL